MRIKTTPIGCVSSACALVEAFDDAMGGLDHVVDSIADMVKTSLAALAAAAQASTGVSMGERGRLVEVELEGCEGVFDPHPPVEEHIGAFRGGHDSDGEAVVK